MAEPQITVTLLGTGSPRPIPRRFSQSTLVEAGGRRLLIDCGRGAVPRLGELEVPLGEVGPVFLTHLHSDHVISLPDLWITGWHLPPTWRTGSFEVYGPTGTREMCQHLEAAYAVDRRVRMEDEGLSGDGIALDVTDIEEGAVWERDGVSVDAIRVEHWPQDDAPPSFGYRVSYAGRSVVFSGDTRKSEHLAEAARGADVFVHEVAFTPSDAPTGDAGAQGARILGHHTSPQQAGEVFAIAQPRLAVYSHIIQWRGATDDDLLTQTRETYDGRVIVGEDLMRIEIGDEIEVSQLPV
jgi:ribonuclease Z